MSETMILYLFPYVSCVAIFCYFLAAYRKYKFARYISVRDENGFISENYLLKDRTYYILMAIYCAFWPLIDLGVNTMSLYQDWKDNKKG